MWPARTKYSSDAGGIPAGGGAGRLAAVLFGALGVAIYTAPLQVSTAPAQTSPSGVKCRICGAGNLRRLSSKHLGDLPPDGHGAILLSPFAGEHGGKRIADRPFYHKPSDSYFTMLQRDGKYYQRRHQIDPGGRQINVMEKQIDFVMGSGNHARAYLHRTARNTLVELPLGWYAEKGGYWAMNPGYDRPDHEGFRRKIAYDCMFCHNGYPKIPAGHDRPFARARIRGSAARRHRLPAVPRSRAQARAAGENRRGQGRTTFATPSSTRRG